jgi:hypothetical protein
MTDTQDALKVTQALLIALQAYEQIGGDSMSLIMLRNKAQAEGREISTEELQAVLADSQAAINELSRAIGDAQ